LQDAAIFLQIINPLHVIIDPVKVEEIPAPRE